MGYIAKNLSTNIIYYSKGANKIATFIGCNPSTITKHFNKSQEVKKIKGFEVSIVVDLKNYNRGSKLL